MKYLSLILIFFATNVLQTLAQNFEVQPIQDQYRSMIGETIRAPLRIKNTTDKPLYLLIRKTASQIGTSQKNYICLDAACMETRNDEHSVKLDPGQTLNNIWIGLEAGLVAGISSVRYSVVNKINPAEAWEIEYNFTVDEKPEKQSLYQSSLITIHDIYPNPVKDFANIDYKIRNDRVKARIVISNILGNIVEEHELSPHEVRLKIKAETFAAGIYFYTLYLDNEAVMTRKLVVRK